MSTSSAREVNATTLATLLGYSKGRISQLVADGTLDGCYRGSGRQRRFNVTKVAKTLEVAIDVGQQMGNGAAAAEKRQSVLDRARRGDELDTTGGDELSPNDTDRHKLIKTQISEEELRAKRRRNAEDEGRFVLADQAALTTKREIAAEIGGFESVLRDGARRIADELGVDFKAARQILRDEWRNYRKARAAQLESEAVEQRMAEAEREADI